MFVKIWHFYVLIIISSLHFSLVPLKYAWNNEIRTIRATTTTIVMKNIILEKKDGTITKMLVDIKRFIKEHVDLALHYATFLIH